MTPEEIVAKSIHSLNNLEPIDGQPSDSDLTRLLEAVVPLLLQIPYDETGAVHNLRGLIRPEAAYVARYSEAFPEPTRLRAYDKNIDDNATAVVHARYEVAHKDKRADRNTYETARRETTQFVLDVVADTWFRELRDSDSLYTKVFPMDIFSNFQVGCTGRHALELLALHNEMHRYHLEVEVIPEYINMVEDTQRQSGRAGRTIADETLLLFASTSMLTSERFPRANNDWEERTERYKTWAQWKTAYKRAHAQARIKAQANDGSAKFGAANSSARQDKTTSPLDNQLEEEDVGIKSLEGYFDNLAVAVVKEKGVLQQLVLNNTTLTTSTKILVALIKKLNGDIKNLERENSRLNKGGQASSRNTTLCTNCKKEVFHQPEACYELLKNKDNRPPGWRSAL